ncbi:hypothetical protein SMICM17S_05591 [Streptomyces microflavus]
MALDATKAPLLLLALRAFPAARLPEEAAAARTSSSESWAACQPVLAVMFTRTKRVSVAGKVTFTALAAPGVKEYAAELFRVAKLVPSALPWRDSVCVRLSQDGGSFRVTSSTRAAVPRSVCTHWGSPPPALSQYVDALPSVVLGAGYSACALLAAAARPAARLGPSAAEAVSDGTPIIRRLVATKADIARHLQRWALIAPRSSASAQGALRARLWIRSQETRDSARTTALFCVVRSESCREMRDRPLFRQQPDGAGR